MTLDPLLNASFTIQFHVCAAFIALLFGPFAIWAKRRGRMHKTAGYIWVVAMTALALSSFAIPSHFSPIGLGPIHALAVFALWGLWNAMRAIFRRDIKTHRDIMRNLYLRGLLIAGAFNFLPGRSFQRMAFPEYPDAGWMVVGVLSSALFLPQVIVFLKARANSVEIALEAPRGLR